MREFIETIKVMGLKGIIGWFKRLLISITLLECISYSVYWLIVNEAMNKMVLIWIPVAAIAITAIEELIREKDICEEEEEIEEEKEEEEVA